jgi:hypothetical protein
MTATGVGIQNLLAHCNICNKTVSVSTLVNRNDVIEALKRGGEVKVMHNASVGDHIWGLSAQDRQNLKNTIDKGLI